MYKNIDFKTTQESNTEYIRQNVFNILINKKGVNVNTWQVFCDSFNADNTYRAIYFNMNFNKVMIVTTGIIAKDISKTKVEKYIKNIA